MLEEEEEEEEEEGGGDEVWQMKLAPLRLPSFLPPSFSLAQFDEISIWENFVCVSQNLKFIWLVWWCFSPPNNTKENSQFRSPSFLDATPVIS